jgi:hypothetical protein
VARVVKSNYSEPDYEVEFTIAENPLRECGVVADLEPSDITAEELVATPMRRRGRTQAARAEAFLAGVPR